MAATRVFVLEAHQPEAQDDGDAEEAGFRELALVGRPGISRRLGFSVLECHA